VRRRHPQTQETTDMIAENILDDLRANAAAVVGLPMTVTAGAMVRRQIRVWLDEARVFWNLDVDWAEQRGIFESTFTVLVEGRGADVLRMVEAWPVPNGQP
jgi:hypothetical protein